MEFAQTLKDRTRLKVHAVDHDFGGDVGVATVYIRELTYKKRTDIFQSKLKPGPDGKYTMDIASADGALHLNAEVVAWTVCEDAAGQKLLATKDAIMLWPNDLVNTLAELVMKTLELLPKPDEKKAGEGEENPSTASD
jgi:hypothetical protein